MKPQLTAGALLLFFITGTPFVVADGLDGLPSTPLSSGPTANGFSLRQTPIPLQGPGNPLTKRAAKDPGPVDLTYSPPAAPPLLNDGTGAWYIPWHDESTGKVFVSVVSPSGAVSRVTLPEGGAFFLGLAVTAEAFYYAVGADGENPLIQLLRTDHQGRLVKKVILPPDADQFNTWRLSLEGGVVVHGPHRVTLAFTHFYQADSDGLHHQASVGAAFDDEDLHMVERWDQLGGHTFDLRATTDGTRTLILDRSDGYPRGIGFHQIDGDQESVSVVVSYKTKMETRDSPYRPGVAAGHWSNDNETYTELGDVVALPTADAVLFATEKSVRNEDAKAVVNESRNLGLVLLSPAGRRGVVAWAPDPQHILSKGQDSPDFGYWTFDGEYRALKNYGVIWLTSYTDKDKETASRPQMVRLDDGRVVVLWELWSAGHWARTLMKVLDPSAQALGTAVDLGAVRLSLGSRPAVDGNRLRWVTAGSKSLVVNTLTLPPGPAPDLKPLFRDPLLATYRQISLPPESLWTLDPNGSLAAKKGTTWVGVPWSARQVAVSLDGGAWAVGTQSRPGGFVLMRWTGLAWIPMEATGIRLVPQADGNPLVLDAQGQVRQFFLSHPQDPNNGTGFWYPVDLPESPDNTLDFGADPSKNQFWRIGSTPAPGGGLVSHSIQGEPWETDGRGAVRVVVDAQALPWILDEQGRVFRGVLDSKVKILGYRWIPVPGQIRDLYSGPGSNVYAIPYDPSGPRLLRWTGKDWEKLYQKE